MRLIAITLLLASSLTFAAEPTTKPKDIAPEQSIGQVLDTQRPAFVPQFAKVNNPPAGNFAERDWARMNTYPAPLLFWPGYRHFGVFGYGHRGFGYINSPSHAFMR